MTEKKWKLRKAFFNTSSKPPKQKIERNLNEGKFGFVKRHFLRIRKHVVCMPWRTRICISVLHKLLLCLITILKTKDKYIDFYVINI